MRVPVQGQLYLNLGRLTVSAVLSSKIAEGISMRMSPRLVSVLFIVTSFTAAQQIKAQDQTQNSILATSPEEAHIVKDVRHNLLMLPYYSIFDDISFSVNGSVVTLEGACPSGPPLDIKSDAAAAVKRVKGVTQVVNNIKELPVSPMDDQIRRAEAKAIYGDPEIGMRYGYQALPSIHIIVNNGHVTLKGVVDNQMDDTMIKMRANQVPNVFSVTDDLIIQNQGKKKEEPGR
jgi:hyperosmotically inducible periplasmic protein